MPRPCAPRSDDLKLPRGSKVAIGFIGLGNIGKPMAKHLLKLGEPVWVCDVAATPVAELVTAGAHAAANPRTLATRSEEHTSELQSLMRTSYAVFCLTHPKPHPTPP